jgi:hypothetical protein
MTFGKLRWLLVLGIFVLAVGRSSHAQDVPAHFNGLINDHTVPGAGSWELHGVWTLQVKGESGKADFTAALTMERSDYFFLAPPGADPSSLAVRNAHTHHVALTGGLVTFIANGFRVTGPATLTGNGATPPFGTNSTLQVDVTGGNLVMYSNIALTFGGDAAKHFGSEPLAGVVSAMKRDE